VGIQASSLNHRLRDVETRWASLDVVDLTDPMVRRAAALAVQDSLSGLQPPPLQQSTYINAQKENGQFPRNHESFVDKLHREVSPLGRTYWNP
jgi:hypothetical protein